PSIRSRVLPSPARTVLYTLSLHDALPILPQLQPDIIKIDRDLIDHVDQDKYKQAIVSKLIDLAKQLQIDVVAEGIERQGELDFLDRRSTRLNSSHVKRSYAVFCSKKNTRT